MSSKERELQLAQFAKEIQHVFREYRVGVKADSFALVSTDGGAPQNTFRVCLLEDVWLTIHLNASVDRAFEIQILKAEADPKPASASMTKAALYEVRPHIQAPFESMDGLLNSVSAEYRARFQERLCHKLEKVA
ncbi:hypothetical protein HK405_003775, partial [Cladochytrium tenue]